MADWEWRKADESASKNLVFSPVLSDDETEFGGHYSYDLTAPIPKLTFEANNAPKSVRDAVKLSHGKVLDLFTLTDNQNDPYSFYIESWNSSNIEGTDRYKIGVVGVEPPALPGAP